MCNIYMILQDRPTNPSAGSSITIASFPGLPTVQFLIACRGRPGIFYHVNDVSVYLGRQTEKDKEDKDEVKVCMYVCVCVCVYVCANMSTVLIGNPQYARAVVP